MTQVLMVASIMFFPEIERQMEWLFKQLGIITEYPAGCQLSTTTPTLGQAVGFVPIRKNLRVVYLSEDMLLEGGFSREETVQDCEHLAQALAEHPNNPVIVLESKELDYLKPTFETRGIKIFYIRPLD